MNGIDVRFDGRIGNQCMQYVVGKILALRTGVRYDPPASFVDGKRKPVIWSGEPLFTMKPTPGKSIATLPSTRRNYAHVHWANLDALEIASPIEGYFQRYELIREYKDRIRNEWLKIPDDRFLPTDPDAVYIHVRRTDFVDIGGGRAPDTTRQCAAATLDEYAACLKHFPDAKRLVLVTDDITDAFLLRFVAFGLPVIIQSLAWDIDFLTLASCRWLLISQSTFSWWAGFLGRAEKIVCPVFGGSYWGNGLGAIGADRAEYPNLLVSDEPGRWVWVTENTIAVKA